MNLRPSTASFAKVGALAMSLMSMGVGIAQEPPGRAEEPVGLAEQIGQIGPSASTSPLQDEVRSESDDPAVQLSRFLRVQARGEQPISMDTAIVSYMSEGPGGVQVDLIGAVHIGEASYYKRLNRLFDDYDVLLYELVAPEGTAIPRGGLRPSGFNPVALMQSGVKSMLGLELQLEQVDYTKAHFVRADMTPGQLAEKMAERGDTPFTLALDTLAEVMRQQNLAANEAAENDGLRVDEELTLADMLANPLKMKRLMAVQFATTGSLDESLGRSLSQLLIADRNAVALREFQKQLAAGKKKIGIFYGAAHLADFEKRLTEDFGLHKTSQEWLTAWDLTQAKERSVSEPVGLLLNILKALE